MGTVVKVFLVLIFSSVAWAESLKIESIGPGPEEKIEVKSSKTETQMTITTNYFEKNSNVFRVGTFESKDSLLKKQIAQLAKKAAPKEASPQPASVPMITKFNLYGEDKKIPPSSSEYQAVWSQLISLSQQKSWKPVDATVGRFSGAFIKTKVYKSGTLVKESKVNWIKICNAQGGRLKCTIEGGSVYFPHKK